MPVKGAFFLDTNILMYAAGAEHPLREPCRQALARAVDRSASLVVDAEVLQEILHRYFAIRRPDLARTVYRATVKLVDEVLPVLESSTERALVLLEEHPGLSPRDAVHVATMEERGLTRILSTDRHFDLVERVERVEPGEFLA